MLAATRVEEMNDFTYENLDRTLLEPLPELQPAYEGELDRWGWEKPGMHSIYGNVLVARQG